MPPQPDSPLRIGIIGLGMAGGGMVSAIRAHPRFVLTGAADREPALRERFARDQAVQVNTDAAELLARDDIDAVYIATPHQFHCEHAELAARHGKHAIVEKPMALSLHDCDRMIAAADHHRTTLIIGHTHSFDPAIARMRELIEQGEYGRLAMIAMWNYTDFLYRPRRAEELDTARGGGILFNQVPHQVDTARLLVGSPLQRVRAMTGVLDPNRPTEGCCMAFLEFAGGVAVSLVYSGYDHFDSDELHGWISEGGVPKQARHGAARAALQALGGGAAERDARRDRFGYNAAAVAAPPTQHQPHFGMLVVSCEHADLRPSIDGVTVYSDTGLRELSVETSHGRPGRSQVLDELYAAVASGTRPRHDGQFGRDTLAACLAIQRSAREHKEIVL